MQITDTHTDASIELTERTYADLRAAIPALAPGLIALTGDIWCSDNAPSLAYARMRRDIDFVASFGVPWTFTWGNHDYAADAAAAWRVLAGSPHACIAPDATDGQYRVTLTGVDGAAAWDLYFINSGAAWTLPRDLSFIRDESTRLRNARGFAAPSICFFHIPLRAYQTAIDEQRVTGTALEKVYYWGDEEGTGADLLAGVEGLRAGFCGHSHRNDCWFDHKGVALCYGRVSGHGGYGADVMPRGIKLIELDLESGHVEQRTVEFA